MKFFGFAYVAGLCVCVVGGLHMIGLSWQASGGVVIVAAATVRLIEFFRPTKETKK